MNNCLPWDITTDAEGGKTEPVTGAQIVRRLIVLMLLTAVVLDLTRCGLVMAAARHPAPTAGLVTAGLAAAALTARTARGCQAGRPWAGWAAVLIGLASAPQAAASGFRSPYLIPDTATAALGTLLAVTILATAGRRPAGHDTGNPPGKEAMTSNEGRSAAIGSSRLLNIRQVLNVIVSGPGQRGLGLEAAGAAGPTQARGIVKHAQDGKDPCPGGHGCRCRRNDLPGAGCHGPARARFPVSGRLHARVGTVGCRLEP